MKQMNLEDAKPTVTTERKMDYEQVRLDCEKLSAADAT